MRMNDEERSLVQRLKRPRPLVLVAIAILASNAPPATADGSSIYAEQCASCHGPDGRADTPVGRALGIRSFEGRSFTLDGVEKLPGF